MKHKVFLQNAVYDDISHFKQVRTSKVKLSFVLPFFFGLSYVNVTEAVAADVVYCDITANDVDSTIKRLRDRVAMPNLLLNSIKNDANWSFTNLSSLINEIRRERRVELVAEGFRWDDIARWAAADELIVGKKPKGFKASQITNTNLDLSSTVDNNGFLDPFKKAMPNGYGFKIDRDYLNSIPESELVLNDKLTQNPGW